jgi:hypothetical protein
LTVRFLSIQGKLSLLEFVAVVVAVLAVVVGRSDEIEIKSRG